MTYGSARFIVIGKYRIEILKSYIRGLQAFELLKADDGYEVSILEDLSTAGFRVCREHPYKVRHHAKGRGRLAKTDRVDAKTLAHYGECYQEQLIINSPTAPLAQELKQL